MRLLDTKTYELCEFRDDNIPDYAILSHTWGRDEPSYEHYDLHKTRNDNGPGYTKIRNACDVVYNMFLRYIWIDTCCIDKRSSAELSEAINSMWTWYAGSPLCLAYLSDVSTPQPDFDFSLDSTQREAKNSDLTKGECRTVQSLLQALSDTSIEDITQNVQHKPNISRARWFTRGWTLQELIAPDHVLFFDSSWKVLGDKVSLKDEISKAAKIPPRYLYRTEARNCCVAQRMSFASTRNTTRREDEAYCLMGLFDINMPLLYGEGYKAFHRLQVEIMNTLHDTSILAWGYPTNDADQEIKQDSENEKEREVLALARRPSDFSNSGGIRIAQWDTLSHESSRQVENEVKNRHIAPSPVNWRPLGARNYTLKPLQHATSFSRVPYRYRPKPYAMTNLGLSITLPLFDAESGYSGILQDKLAFLGLIDENSAVDEHVCLHIRERPFRPDNYVRLQSSLVYVRLGEPKSKETTFYLRTR